MLLPRLFTSVALLAAFAVAVAKTPRLDPQHPVLPFNIVAIDSHGAPVRNLRAEDLRIYDDGQLMQAAFCRPLLTSQPEVALASNQYSNRPLGGNDHSTLILLDLLNSDSSQRSLAWSDIGRSLQNIAPGERVFLYLLSKEGKFYPIHSFHDREDANWTVRAPELLDRAMSDLNGLRPWNFQIDVYDRVKRTMSALRELTADFASQPGARNLVWISRGTSLNIRGRDAIIRDFTPALQDLGTDLARSGIILYALDETTPITRNLTGLDDMQLLAGLTGGEWFPVNNIAKAIRDARAEPAATFQVGYVPSLDRWNNKFHTLRVTTTQKGVRIRATNGYLGRAQEADPILRLALASRGPSDEPGIGLISSAESSTRVSGWQHIRIRVDAADLQLTAGDDYAGKYQVMLAFYTDTWQPEVTEEKPADLHLNSAQRDAVLRDGITVSLDSPVPAGTRKVRVVVRDLSSGAIGSLTVPLMLQ